jgi:2,4-dienoyl-CoA reductase-like NADH-dependent reductase (Old Yellow Enzyme family)
MENDVIVQPLRFRNLTVKNHIFQSKISGRFNNYEGSGTQTRLNWAENFAQGGVRAILSSFCSAHIRGRIVPNYAMIDDDGRIPFWRKVGEIVHGNDCKFISQLGHSGRRYRLTHFCEASGYANQPLDGIWARGPDLHNVSVPTLWDLLQSPENRPQRFSRGYDIHDKEKVGCIPEEPGAERADFR